MTSIPNDYPKISKAKIQLYAKLESKKFRSKHHMFIAQGHKSVIDTIGAFNLVNICATPEWINANISSFEAYRNLISSASPQQLKKMSSLKNAPDVIAVYWLPDDDTGIPKLEKDKLYVLIDGIQDPGNLGSILRTADWFGIRDIFASPDTVDIYNPKALMATMGSLARVRIRYLNLPDLIRTNPSFPVYGTLLDGCDIYKTNMNASGMVVFCNEGQGLSPEIRELIDRPILIPPFNPASHAESLNVGAAAAVVLAEFRRSQIHNTL